jgi:hypothetical protein
MLSPSIPEVAETSFKLNPHQPRITKESSTQMKCLSKSQKVVNHWFQLFYEILDDEKLTDKFWSTIKLALGAEGNPKEFIVANIPKRNASRV